jgi:hypothetical protein
VPSTFDIVLDGKPFSVNVEGSPEFSVGKAERLSRPDSDITFGQDWYQQGYAVLPFISAAEFAALHDEIERLVRNLLDGEGIATGGFQLVKYHEFVTTDQDHLRIVRRTRDLFDRHFSFSIGDFIRKLTPVLGFDLTDIDPDTGSKVHIIVRINRPGSGDYNPPHKDVYETWDQSRRIPPMVNFWIPICGVTDRSSLPVVAGSHLLAEDKIVRTVEGGVVGGRKYRVRNIKSWDGRNEMTRVRIAPGEILVFSSHLIHGFAINEQHDQTRVALEFRLLKRRNGRDDA